MVIVVHLVKQLLMILAKNLHYYVYLKNSKQVIKLNL